LQRFGITGIGLACVSSQTLIALTLYVLPKLSARRTVRTVQES
jgi:hypothetical protein